MTDGLQSMIKGSIKIRGKVGSFSFIYEIQE